MIYLAVLAAAGLVISIELLRIHLVAGSDPWHPFSCRISQAMDCNAVARSREAYFLGVPVPVWSIAWYLVFLGLGGLGLVSRKPPLRNAADYALPLSLWSLAYSVYLAQVSLLKLRTYCAFCAGLYGVNAGLVLAAVLAAGPIASWFPRRKEDWRWLSARPVWMGAALVAVAAGAGGLVWLQSWSGRPETITISSKFSIDVSHDPSLGYFRAPLTIIEFSDYECPACRRMHPTIKALLQLYEGKIKLVHKNFPLDSRCNPSMTWRMHPHACDAAAAAECAFRQGDYEAYAERLWTSNDLSVPNLVRIAQEQGLDPGAFQQCMNSPEVKESILKDIQVGDQLKIEATPTFIVKKYAFVGAHDVKYCTRFLDHVLRGEIPPEDEEP